ncbi:hypothetical protein [Dietzia sp. SYD-A1]|uniref:hypothetical protein n=1 Tax=Dietzia sp. SYD-A1 TaxID=2780141 RepID=UPI0018915EB5|nr:hypothetical protein [Dietzia sp. SYD-A1]
MTTNFPTWAFRRATADAEVLFVRALDDRSVDGQVAATYVRTRCLTAEFVRSLAPDTASEAWTAKAQATSDLFESMDEVTLLQINRFWTGFAAVTAHLEGGAPLPTATSQVSWEPAALRRLEEAVTGLVRAHATAGRFSDPEDLRHDAGVLLARREVVKVFRTDAEGVMRKHTVGLRCVDVTGKSQSWTAKPQQALFRLIGDEVLAAVLAAVLTGVERGFRRWAQLGLGRIPAEDAVQLLREHGARLDARDRKRRRGTEIEANLFARAAYSDLEEAVRTVARWLDGTGLDTGELPPLTPAKMLRLQALLDDLSARCHAVVDDLLDPESARALAHARDLTR